MGQLNTGYCTGHNSRCSGHNSKWKRFKNEVTFSARFRVIFFKALASKSPMRHYCSCFSEREVLTLLRVHTVTQWAFVEGWSYDHSMDRCSVRTRQWEVRPHLSATATEADGCPVGACCVWSLTLSKDSCGLFNAKRSCAKTWSTNTYQQYFSAVFVVL